MNTQRTFIPGDNWLYFKLYTGFKTADVLIRDIIPAVVKPLLDSGTISKWFFIRYNDPEFHLRLRFFLPDKVQVGLPLQKVNEALQYFVQQNLVWKVQLDTYQRELERYGSATMELSETLFFYDSSTLALILKSIQGSNEDALRWQSAVVSIDYLLDDFSYSTEQKIEFLSMVKSAFSHEFGLEHSKQQLAAKYRERRKEIEEVLSRNSEKHTSIYYLLASRSAKQQYLAKQIQQLLGDAKPLNELLSSYTHMMMNRWFRSKQRMHEAVIYDMLYTYYKSKMGRESKSKQQI